MIVAVVLAAGLSKRIGRPKALLRYKKQSFLNHILINLQTAGINNIFVVLGQEFDRVKGSFSNKNPYIFIHNPHPEEGPLSSFKLALQKMPRETQGCLLVLVDHPLVTAETYRYIKYLGEKHQDAILIPVFKGQNGHPVYFGKKFFPQLLQAPLTEGARYVVHHNQQAIHKFETDDHGVIADIDTKDDFDLYINNG